mmetsp:Transcript_13215/g.31330  ORF Transcript_13215/g.31330 Transcript_13215/m.31330 type:complete len:816 (-) Transcript_13215:79-2526(-)
MQIQHGPSSPLNRVEDVSRFVHSFSPEFFGTSFCAQVRCNTSRFLGSLSMRRFSMLLVCLYLVFGASAVLMEVGVICINPLDRHVVGELRPVRHPTRLRFTPWTKSQLQVPSGALGRDFNESPEGIPEGAMGQRSIICEPPYTGNALTISCIIGNSCLCISIFTLVEHWARMYTVGVLYFFRCRALALDFCFTTVANLLDGVIVFVLRPRLARAAEEHEHAKVEMVLILFCRVWRLTLLWRLFRALTSGLDEGEEVALIHKAVEALRDEANGMPGILLREVQVVASTAAERRAYCARMEALASRHSGVMEYLLFCGSGSTSTESPKDVVLSAMGLDHDTCCDRHMPKMFSAADRPVYTDCCHAFTDWQQDPTGRTRQLIVVRAIAGETTALDKTNFFKSITWTKEQGADLLARHDCVEHGPVAPVEYMPQELGAEPRNVASKVYGVHEPKGQVLPLAIITYQNPDTFAEIELLRQAGVNSWPDLYMDRQKGSRFTAEQARALENLKQAIDCGNAGWLGQALEWCRKLMIRERDIDAVKQGKRRESEDAGICLAYLLSQEFTMLARTRTGKEDPTFLEMRDPFFLDKGGGNPLIGESKLCPRDLERGCAFVDTVDKQHRGKANVFLSWVWQYRLSMVQDGLRRWVGLSKAVPEETFLFMCFFCNNQWRILVEKKCQGSDGLQDIFEGRLKGMGRVVALMDSWDNPLYVQRIWTIYEQFVCVKLGVEVEFILPSGPAATLITELEKGAEGIGRVLRAVAKVEAESARASFEQDERRGKDMIAASVGFAEVNQQVRHRINHWIASEFKKWIDTLLDRM